MTKPKEQAGFDEIAVLVSLVENSKQIHLSEDERTALIHDLHKLGYTFEHLKQMGENVRRNADYGRISIDNWLKSERVYTQSELYHEFQTWVNRRKEEFRAIRDHEFTDEELAKEGLEESAAYYQQCREQALNKYRVSLEKRLRKVRIFITTCDESIKLEILELAEKKGFYKKDEFWRISLPYFAPQLVEEVEQIMKRL